MQTVCTCLLHPYFPCGTGYNQAWRRLHCRLIGVWRYHGFGDGAEKSLRFSYNPKSPFRLRRLVGNLTNETTKKQAPRHQMPLAYQSPTAMCSRGSAIASMRFLRHIASTGQFCGISVSCHDKSYRLQESTNP